MFVLVSLKIEVDATATLSQMESQIEEAGRAASDPKRSSKPLEWPKSSRPAVRSVGASRAVAKERSAGCC